MSDRLRIIYAWRNGDEKQKSPFRITVNVAGTFEEMVEKVSATLSKRGGPVHFTRAFGDDGSELVDVEAIKDGETVVFSTGEEYAGYRLGSELETKRPNVMSWTSKTSEINSC